VPSPETKRLTRLRLRPSDAQLWRLCSIRSRYVAQCWGNRTRMTGHSDLEAIGARQRLLPNHPSSLSSRARRVLRVVWAGTPTRLHESDRRHLARLRHGPRARLNLGPTTVQQGVTAGNAVMERPRHQGERMAHVNSVSRPCRACRRPTNQRCVWDAGSLASSGADWPPRRTLVLWLLVLWPST
jgi:hypothetical protein